MKKTALLTQRVLSEGLIFVNRLFEEAQIVFYDDLAKEFYNDKYPLPEPYQSFERYKGLIAYSPFI